MNSNSNVGGEFRNLKQHGSATMHELRQFLEQMRGKSPREMLGALAESGLIRATTQATIGCVALLAAFTVGPYLLKGERAANGAADSAKAPAPSASSTAASSSTKQDDSTGKAAPSPSSASTPLENPPPPTDLESAAKKQGVGDTKHADPKSNPLEKELDNLLDKAK